MAIFEWSVSIVIVALLIYSLAKPYLRGVDYTKLKQPDFSIEEEFGDLEVKEEVLQKPVPKKRKPYKKRKPKNATAEKKGL
jgi:hypothetical protein